VAIGNFILNETAPAAPGTAASSQPVTGASANYLQPGVAGPLDDFEAFDVIAEITAGTGGNLDVYLQTSPDNGANFYDTIHFPQAAGGSGTKIYAAPLSLATTTAFAIQVGKNLVPALVASATAGVVNGAFTDRARLVMVAGAGTSVAGTVVLKMMGQRPRVREHGE
jgi:hypothetical protein